MFICATHTVTRVGQSCKRFSVHHEGLKKFGTHPAKRTSITNHLLIPLRFSFHLFTSSQDYCRTYVKGIKQSGKGFKNLRYKFPHKSDTKVREDAFVGPHIKELMNDIDFHELLNKVNLTARQSLKQVIINFFWTITNTKLCSAG